MRVLLPSPTNTHGGSAGSSAIASVLEVPHEVWVYPQLQQLPRLPGREDMMNDDQLEKSS